jgi:polysaccharide biosynthesis/export protein
MRTMCAVFIAALFVSSTAAQADTLLHAGDKIDVTVFNHVELSGILTIDASGYVSLPVAGTVRALDIDSNALAAIITNRLTPYVRQVAVQVKLDSQTTNIFVSGGPNGVIAYTPGMTIGSAVAYLGWPASASAQNSANAQQLATYDNATGSFNLLNGPIDFHHVSIVRNGTTIGPFDVIRLRETGQLGLALEPNDTIQLIDKPIAVQVAGDVEHPGVAYLDTSEPLSQALKQVGGPAGTSRIDQLQLVRDGQTRYVSAGGAEFSLPARDGDELLIPRAAHVDVLGNVARPGDTMLRASNSLVSAIYYAGGPAKYANLRAVQVIHDGQKQQFDLGKLQKGAGGQNPQLEDGDVVFVPQGSTFEWGDLWGALGSIGLFAGHL